MSADAEKDDVVDKAESDFGADDASNETKENNTGSDDSTKDETDGDSLLAKDKYIILKCEKCLKVFGTRHSLVRHLKRSSICGTNPERHRCGTCYRVYATRNGLHRHQRSSLECRKAGDISDDHNTSTEDKSIMSTVLSPNSKSVKEVSEPSTPLSSIASGNLSMSNAPSASSSPRESIASSPSSKPTTPSKSDTSNDLSLRGKSMTPKKSPTDDVPSTPHKDTIFNLPCKIKNDESFSCEKCNETFVSKEEIEKHKQCSHSDVERKSNKPESRKSEQLTCDKCGKLYTSKNGLKEHIKNSPECHLESPNKPGTSSKTERRFKCEKCGKVFMARGDLMEHLKSSTTCSGDSEGTPCKYCGKPYIKINSLRRHERNHKENNSLQCPFCTKCFSTETGIKSHIEKIHDKKADEFIHLPEKRKSTSQSNSSRSKTKSAVVAKKDDTPPVVNSKTQSAINLTGVKSDVDHVLPGKTSHQTNLQKLDHISDQSNINPYANTFKTNVYNPDNHINYPNIHEQICSPQAGSYKVEQLPHELNFNHNYDNKANHIIDPSYSSIHHLKPNQYHDYRNVNPPLQNFKDGTNLSDNIPGTSHQTMNTNIVNTKEIDDIIDHVLASQLNNPQQMSTPKPEYMSNQGNIHVYMNTTPTNMYSHTSPPFHSNSHDRTCTPETSTYKKEHIPNQGNYNQFLNSSEFTSNENPPMTRLDFSSERLGLNPHSSNQYRSPQVNTTSTTPIPSHNYISESINITQQDNYPGGDIPISEQPNAPVNFNSEISNTNIGAPGNTYFRDHLNPFLTNYIQDGISGETQTASMSQNFTHTNINEKDSTHASTSSSTSFQDAYSPYHASCSNSADKTQITSLTCEEPMLTDLDYRPDTDEQATEKSFTVLTPARLSTNHSQPNKFFPNEYYNPNEGHPQGSMNSSLTGIPYTESVDGPSHMYQNDYMNRVHQYPYRKNYDSVQDNPMNQNFTPPRNDMPMQPSSHHNNSERDDGTQNVSTFRDRINYNPEAKLIKCMFCSKTFCTKSGLRYHTKKYHPDKLHTISSIPQMATQYPGHIQVSTNQNVGSAINETTSKGCEINIKAKGPLQCLSCDKTFFTKPGLKGHTEKSHNNGECSQGKQPKTNLNQDPEQKRNEEAKNECAEIKISKTDQTTFFHCMFCEKRFSSKNGIRWHTKNHHSLEDFQKTNLLLGKLRISGTRARVETSNIDLSRLTDVQPSIKLVKNSSGNMQEIKSFECLMCDKSFAAKHGLKSHVIRHHGDKPFIRKKPVHLDKGLDWIKCTICEKRFLTNSELRCHLDKDHDSPTAGVSSNLSPNGAVAHTVDYETSASASATAEHKFENQELLFESSSDQKTEDVKFSGLNLNESVFNQLESSQEYTMKREILSTIQDKIMETKANDHGTKQKPDSTELHTTDFNFLNFGDIRNLTIPNNNLNSGSSSAAAQNDSILLYDNIIKTTDIAPLYTCEMCKMQVCKCNQSVELSVPNNNLNPGSSSAAAQNDSILLYENIIQTTGIAPLYTCEMCKMQVCKCNQSVELSVPNNNLTQGSSSAAAQNDSILLFDNIIKTTDIVPLYTCEICKMQICKCNQSVELSVPNNNLTPGSSSAAAQNDSILLYENIIKTTDIAPLYTCEMCKMQVCKCNQSVELSVPNNNLNPGSSSAAAQNDSILLYENIIQTTGIAPLYTCEMCKMQVCKCNQSVELSVPNNNLTQGSSSAAAQNDSILLFDNIIKTTDIVPLYTCEICKMQICKCNQSVELSVPNNNLTPGSSSAAAQNDSILLFDNIIQTTDIAPLYTCEICKMQICKCNQRDEVRNNISAQIDNAGFMCKLCPAVFSGSIDLLRHTILEHKKTVPANENINEAIDMQGDEFNNTGFDIENQNYSQENTFKEIETDILKDIETDILKEIETDTLKEIETDILKEIETETLNFNPVIEEGNDSTTNSVHSMNEANENQSTNEIGNRNRKSFECKKCYKIFDQKSALLLHKKEHLMPQTFHCQFCSRSFCRKKFFLKHILNKHSHSPKLEEIKTEDQKCNENDTNQRDETVLSNLPIGTTETELTVSNTTVTWNQDNQNNISNEVVMDSGENKNTTLGESQQPTTSSQEDQGILQKNECQTNIIKTDVCFAKDTITEKISESSKTVRATCKICNRHFSSLKILHVHLMDHVKTPYGCKFCNRIFPNSRSLVRHATQKHKFDITLAKKMTNFSEVNLERVVAQIAHKDANDQVISDNLECSNKSSELPDEKVRFATKMIKSTCKICNRTFDTKKSLKLHMMEHVEQPSACSDCGRLFPTRRSLMRHRVQKHRESFDKDQLALRKLTSSEQSRTVEQPSVCSDCGRLFSTRRSLMRHRVQKHRESFDKEQLALRKVPSSRPKSTVTTKEVLEKRKYHRTLQSEYTCNICNEKFNMKKLLRVHMQQHLKDGPMTCPICNRVFATRLSLIKHNIQIHKKRNKFRRNAAKHNRLRSKTCDICEEEFENWKEMRIHRRTHDSKGPVKCEICDAFLATKGSLKRHMDKVHETVVPERSGVSASTSKRKVPLVRILEKKDYISPHAWAKDSKKGHVFDDFDHLNRKEISYLEHRVDDKKMMEKMGLRGFFLDRLKNESDAKNASKQNTEVSEVDKNQKDDTIEINDQENVEPELFAGHIKLKKNFEKMLVTKFGKCLQIDFPESLENEFYIPFDYEDDIALEFFISDEKLLNNLNSIVIKLFDKSTLDSFGWPETSAEKIISEIVTKCGRVPGVRRKENITSHIRQNFTLLFKYVINTDVSKKLLSVHTVDELILQILKFNENEELNNMM